jgi:hypothetical protein
MPPEVPADDYLVANLNPRRTYLDIIGYPTNTTGVDVHAIAVAAFDNLCVTSHNPDSALSRGFTHRHRDPSQVINSKSLFHNETRTQCRGPCATHCQIVDCPTHGEFTDVAAREEQRADDK